MAACHCYQAVYWFFLSRFIKGFITRNQPSCTDNSEYLAYVRHNYLTRLTENLPKTVLEKDAWLTPPPILQEVCHTFVQELFAMKPCVANYGKSVSMLKIPFQASQLLKKLYFRHMVRKYVRGIAPQRKAQVLLWARTTIHSWMEIHFGNRCVKKIHFNFNLIWCSWF